MKKIAALIIVLVLVSMLAGCGGSGDKNSHTSETVYGQVLSVDGSSVKLLLGTLNEMNPPSDVGSTKPEAGSDGETPRNNEAPQGSGTPKGDPGGPGKGSLGGPQAGSDGEAVRGFNDGKGMPQFGQMYVFKAGEETITVDAGDLLLKTDDIIEVVFDKNGKVSSLSLREDVFIYDDMKAINDGGKGNSAEGGTKG